MHLRAPLRHSIPALILAAGVATFTAAYFIDRNALDRNLQRLAEEQLRSTATFVAGGLEAAFRAKDPGDARATIERATSNRQIKLVLLVGPNGVIRYASDAAMVGKPIYEIDNASQLLQVLEPGNGSLNARISALPDGGVAGRFPVQMRGLEQDFLPNEFGELYMVYDLSVQASRQRWALLQRMAPRALILAGLTFVFWILFRWVLLRRINKLVESVRAVGKGDFSNEPDIRGVDELAELGKELSGMMRQLQLQSERASFLADHDALTGLLNRHGFETEIDSARRYGQATGKQHVVCLLDIDSLRVINDTKGHMVGDELLHAFGQFLVDEVEGAEAAARVGGDEFALLLRLNDSVDIETLALKLQATIREFRFSWEQENFSVQVSIGMVLLDERIENSEAALGLADTACYAAKEQGRGRYAIWQSGTEEWARKHGQMRWVSRIQRALDEDRFVLYAQTIEPLSRKSGQGLHLEILVRMLDEEGHLVPPGDFLGAAERYNLVGKIDRWVIQETLQWLESNPASRQAIDMCAINLSGLSFGDKGLLDEIRAALGRSMSVRPSKLCFEVTETAAITNLGHAREFIDRLREMGCLFALDDFGSGVSSFGYLKNLPVDFIKIDGMFVRDIVKDPADRAIVSSINNIAHEMGKQTIAEFAENQEVINLLRKLGVDYAQGYGISRPQPLDEVAGAMAIEKLKRA